MKKLLIFASFLTCFYGAFADDADTARAAARGTNPNIATTTRTSASSRAQSTTRATPVARTATTRVPITATRSAIPQARTVSSRTPTPARTATVSRVATPVKSTPVARSATPTRIATPIKRTTARATTITPETISGVKESGNKYTNCRKVFMDCMDEFCANKDANLKRCACSTRATEFDGLRLELAEIESQMMDFNRRLLTVNMDAEDAMAISTATEGELAFNVDDRTESQKILDEIAEKLATANEEAADSQANLATSFTIDTDAAFDDIDSLFGTSTSTKNGVDLYNAALPVCREMAMEICDEEMITLVESSYNMNIEQDCNTVDRAYKTRFDTAMAKATESGALLDMTRLDNFQARNRDDILTCKKKMLEYMSDDAVCGTGLIRCLDTTGKYIDPATGNAFLTPNLGDLAKLLVRPGDRQKWSTVPNNKSFVSFMESKRQYLEPAMANCEQIAPLAWRDFIDDALGQIKLEQTKKLEEFRQSCTTLTLECANASAKSINEFDARAMSIFGVLADKTAIQMCASIKDSCTALMQSDVFIPQDQWWEDGMMGIATDKTYETILSTCKEIGRQCIIKNCRSTYGNFALCEGTNSTVNRKSVVSRGVCWNEVLQCVKDTGDANLTNIVAMLGDEFISNPYKTTYGFDTVEIMPYGPVDALRHCDDINCVADSCRTSSGNEKVACRIAEKIWGNCERYPSQYLTTPYDTFTNRIVGIDANGKPTVDTLLTWFALNTGTTTSPDSCSDTSCPAGEINIAGPGQSLNCVSDEFMSSNKVWCAVIGSNNDPEDVMIMINGENTNCCGESNLSADGCCINGYWNGGICNQTNTTPNMIPVSEWGGASGFIADAASYDMICSGGEFSYETPGVEVSCSGDVILVATGANGKKVHHNIPGTDSGTGIITFYNQDNADNTYNAGHSCVLTINADGTWDFISQSGGECNFHNADLFQNNLLVEYLN